MFLSRLTLRRTPDVTALAQVLNPSAEGRRLDAHHRLIWSVFAGDPDARRDFLWRDMGQGTFLVLSPREPGESALFERPETNLFAPDLRAGDCLAFVLRANATRTVTEADGRKRHRDVVMEALTPLPQSARASARLELAQQAGKRWMEGQGARAGFRVAGAGVTAYRVAETLPRRSPGRSAGPRFGILDLEGTAEVTDPAAFLDKLARGFGRAKAFGCGLMLIRRA